MSGQPFPPVVDGPGDDPGDDGDDLPPTWPEEMRPIARSWPFRGSRPGWAPSANPRGLNSAELAALENFFRTRKV